MSATVQAAERAVGPAAVAQTPRPRAVTLPLAMVEGRRLLGQPLIIVAAELSLYVHVRGVPLGQMPVIPRDDIKIGYALLPLAAATLLAVNWAALRSRRHGTEELYESLPTPAVRSTAAYLLSVVAPIGLAVGIVVLDLLYLVLLGGVGTPNPFELATGPAVVALAGVFGVLLARLAPWKGMAAVMAVGLAASWYFPYWFFRISGRVWIWRSFWLFPWYGTRGSVSDWAQAFAGGWHLAYVGGFIALLACLALACHRRSPGILLTAALAFALTVASAVAQVPPLTATRMLEEARFASGAPGTQECKTRLGVRYCAWPAYVSWIDRWQRPIAGVLRRLPAAAGRPELRVRQMELGAYEPCWDTSACQQQLRAVIERAFADSDVRPTSSWPRGDGQGRAELALAASTGAWAVGLPTAPPAENGILMICTPREARVVVALWLAGQSTSQAEESLRARTGPREQVRSRLTLGSDVVMTLWPWHEAVYAVALLDRPADEVAAQLRREWSRWTSPDTPTAELVKAFGLTPLPPLQETTELRTTGPAVGNQPECV